MSRYRIRIGRLFKADPDLAVHIIRLMAAENDFFTTVTSMERLPEPKDPNEKSRFAGQRVYFFRISCGHLHEAIQVLKQLPKDCPSIMARAPRELNDAYSKIATTIFPLEKNLSRLRAHATFHYDKSELIRVLREWGEDAEGETVTGQSPDEVRHFIADEAFSTAISRSFGFPSDIEGRNRAFERLIHQIIGVQADLVGFIRILLGTVRSIYPDSIEPLDE